MVTQGNLRQKILDVINQDSKDANKKTDEILNLFNNLWDTKEECSIFHFTDWAGKCFNCGKQVFTRENKQDDKIS